jgi:hypothetical protein
MYNRAVLPTSTASIFIIDLCKAEALNGYFILQSLSNEIKKNYSVPVYFVKGS